MTKTLSVLSSLIIVLIFSCSKNSKTFTEADINIIPKPEHSVLNPGSFQFNQDTKFYISDENQRPIAQILASKFKTAAGWDLGITTEQPATNYVAFKTNDSLPDEAYKLNIKNQIISIEANSYNGFLYGLESVRMLLPNAIESSSLVDGDWLVPNIEITDGPRFKWRGLMLDLSRHFFDKEYIKKTIDRLAFLKMNTLHLHLVDDQGWRIEIKKYPKLTEIGAYRVNQEDKPWSGRRTTDPSEKGTYGGFLTQEDAKEIVAYAQTRGVNVVPEIEMPAHVMSAIASYPELSCQGKPVAVPSGSVWPITDIYCPGKESTFDFLEDVLTEIMAIFPSKYIHVGGDEATKTNWKTCPYCQKRIKEEHLANVEELQSYFIKRIERFLSSKGRTLIGWDEILEGGLAPGATVMSWRGVKGGLEASEQGHDVVMTPGTHCYFDHYQGPQDSEPLAFGGFTPLSKVYTFDPVVDGMTPEQAKHVLGGQANLWAEYIPTTAHSEYMIYPRLAALSETLWSPKDNRSWDEFTPRIKHMMKRFGTMGINYAKSAYTVTSETKVDTLTNTITVNLKNEFPNSDIRYVLNNADINTEAIPFTAPIKITETTSITASLFENDAPVGRVFSKTYTFDKAVGKKVIYQTKYSKNYPGTGNTTLVNILRGSKNFRDGQWQAWLNKDMDATLDLGKPTKISTVSLGTMENQGPSIFFPTRVEVWVSNDGKNFTSVGSIDRPFKSSAGAELKDFTITFEPQEVQYVKVKASCLKDNPRGGAWLFVDELIVD